MREGEGWKGQQDNAIILLTRHGRVQGEVLTNSLGRDEVAEVGTEEDEDKWEGHPHQELQRQAGLHLGIGPLVDCRDTC